MASADAPKLGSVDHVGDEFVQHRVGMFEKLYAEQQAEREKAAAAGVEIEITLPNGDVKKGIASKTSAMDIAQGINPMFARSCVVATIDFGDGSEPQLRDMTRPIEKSCKLVLHKYMKNKEEEDETASQVFKHSSAHILGETIERLYNGKLTIGPALEDEFYYDVDLAATPYSSVSANDFKVIEGLVKKVVKEKQEFQRIEMTKAQAKEMFKDNSFKQDIIEQNISDDDICTAYRCGPLVDLCRGPHIPSTGMVKTFMVTRNSGCYWKNDQKNPQLQRIYGVAFPDKGKMKEYKAMVTQAKKYGHKNVGNQQQLFFFDELSPGSCFWEPMGARIYNKLIGWIQGQYRERGYTEVITPNVFNMKLWETSGHADKYRDDMFLFDVEGQEFGMKPMNCPGHCVMFKHRLRSYRDLPMRYADFGVLHRNEDSGALHGLTRVRRFQQDDAHIFCRMDQIETEVLNCLEFVKFVYDKFGFKLTFMLSTRPENFLGEIPTWDKAEAALENCLKTFCSRHEEIADHDVKRGDGAFYGPKIDIEVRDSMKRAHQCATVQLDFQLPQRFDLEYAPQKKPEDGSKTRPVIVHRAILGSLERFIAVLTEHLMGRWPFWMSPRQMIVVPTHADYFGYAEEVAKIFHDQGYWTSTDLSNRRLNKMIRESQVNQWNYILVVGKTEQDERSVNARFRDDPKRQEKMTLDEATQFFKDLMERYQ